MIAHFPMKLEFFSNFILKEKLFFIKITVVTAENG